MFVPKKRSHKRAKQDPAAGARVRKPGRPLKQPSELAPPRAEMRHQQKLLHEQYATESPPVREGLSSMERLPVEIIQQIFFLCLETNLANTSLTLNLALSHENIYRALILFAYFDANPEWPTETSLFKPAGFRYLAVKERCHLQQSIWKFRWCTVDRLKAAMSALSHLAMVQRWNQQRVNEKSRPKGESATSIIALPDINNTEAMKIYFQAPEYADPKLVYETEESISGWDTVQGNGDGTYIACISYWYHYLNVAGRSELQHGSDTTLGVRHFPSGLVTGPWTHETISLLVLLRQGIRYLGHADTVDISAEALFRGMEAAITDPQTWRPMTTLTVLLELWWHVLAPRGPVWDPDPPPSQPLPLRLFHLAIEQVPNELGFMELLIRAGLESIPGDDTIITGWALRMKAKSGSVTDVRGAVKAIGSWLLDYMTLQDPESSDFRVFNNGKLSRRAHREGFYPFPDQSFTQELGYLEARAVKPRPDSLN